MSTALSRARPFTHRENGTDESTWLMDARWDDVPRLDLGAVIRRHPKVLFVAPHPDDESLSLGATLAHLAANGVEVTVAVATHGGDGPRATPRRIEGEQAIAALSPRIGTVWWDFSDGKLATVEDELAERLGAVVDEHTVLLAPVEHDGHTDHEAVARVAERVARDRGAALLQYPVWLWHWATPSDLDWARLRTLAPPVSALNARRDAIGCYRSQLSADGDAPIVGSAVLARARRVAETVLIPNSADLAERVAADVVEAPSIADTAAPFDAMFADSQDDPWHFDDSPYEQRRLDLVVACLGRERYSHAIDIGCATGQLAARLSGRAEAVTGLDASAAALRVAKTRSPDVRWLLGRIPNDLPQERFDLIVLSEVAYFLDGPDLLTTLRTVRRALLPGGEIVLANWRHPTEKIPLDGPTAHEQAAAMFDLPRRARYEDADLLIEVWGSPVSVHEEDTRET